MLKTSRKRLQSQQKKLSLKLPNGEEVSKPIKIFENLCKNLMLNLRNKIICTIYQTKQPKGIKRSGEENDHIKGVLPNAVSACTFCIEFLE